MAGAFVYDNRHGPGHVRRLIGLVATPFLWAGWTYRKLAAVHREGRGEASQ